MIRTPNTPVMTTPVAAAAKAEEAGGRRTGAATRCKRVRCLRAPRTCRFGTTCLTWRCRRRRASSTTWTTTPTTSTTGGTTAGAASAAAAVLAAAVAVGGLSRWRGPHCAPWRLPATAAHGRALARCPSVQPPWFPPARVQSQRNGPQRKQHGPRLGRRATALLRQHVTMERKEGLARAATLRILCSHLHHHHRHRRRLPPMCSTGCCGEAAPTPYGTSTTAQASTAATAATSRRVTRAAAKPNARTKHKMTVMPTIGRHRACEKCGT